MTDKLGYYQLVQFAPFFVVLFIIIMFVLLYNYLEWSSHEEHDWKESWDKRDESK
mgnify:CR=1 FL=1|jgi:predicted permease|tara:strand:- start:724 stop:888 length:165 start_codon:yes stop_codon:yes gene_type:complete